MNPATHFSTPPTTHSEPVPPAHPVPEERLPSTEMNVGKGERYLSLGAGIGLLAVGIARRGIAGWVLGTLGALLVTRGATGKCLLYQKLRTSTAPSPRHGVADNLGIKIEHSLWIGRPAAELFEFFRDFRNLAPAMKQIQEVEQLGDGHFRWRAELNGKEAVWETRLINEHPNELLAWESLPGAEIQNAGTIRFHPEGNGTRLNLIIDYFVPGGLITALKQHWYRDPLAEKLQHDLEALKRQLEEHREE